MAVAYSLQRFLLRSSIIVSSTDECKFDPFTLSVLALTALGIYAYIMFIRPARQKFHDDEVKGETRPSDVTPNSAKFMVSAVITGIDSILSEQIKQHISAHKASTPNSRKNSALTKYVTFCLKKARYIGSYNPESEDC